MMKAKKWNWQQTDWPNFSHRPHTIALMEEEFLKKAGESFGILKHISEDEKRDVTIQFLSNEAFKTSEIEGEILDRESLQSSIKRKFGLKVSTSSDHPAEDGIAEMMVDLYKHYEEPLSHEILWSWHKMLMKGRHDLHNVGCYRTSLEPMQIVSGYAHNPKVHFEAPPSQQMKNEMDKYIQWFNKTAPGGESPLLALTRSSIAHLYFVSIHPFEDGNGRIGRALVEKVIGQHLRQPTLVALSQVIKDHRKAYYEALEHQNDNNHIDSWLSYFGQTILKAQQYTIDQLDFIIRKTKFFNRFKDEINDRQYKAVLRIMKEGPEGFKGGLSAKNYMTITHASASTATRDLQDFVEKGIFTQTGTRKSTRYWLLLP